MRISECTSLSQRKSIVFLLKQVKLIDFDKAQVSLPVYINTYQYQQVENDDLTYLKMNFIIINGFLKHKQKHIKINN